MTEDDIEDGDAEQLRELLRLIIDRYPFVRQVDAHHDRPLIRSAKLIQDLCDGEPDDSVVCLTRDGPYGVIEVSNEDDDTVYLILTPIVGEYRDTLPCAAVCPDCTATGTWAEYMTHGRVVCPCWVPPLANEGAV